MTTKFTASNGVEIEPTENGCLGTGGSIGQTFVGPKAVKALREFFQHERDRELGRWRDPVHPNFVVYRVVDLDDNFGRAIQTLDETTGDTFFYWEKLERPSEGIRGREVVNRYFAAHPETKPWDEAETGDIWELTGADGLKQAWVRNGTGGWVSINAPKVMYYDGRGVTAGRRIWPEED